VIAFLVFPGCLGLYGGFFAAAVFGAAFFAAALFGAAFFAAAVFGAAFFAAALFGAAFFTAAFFAVAIIFTLLKSRALSLSKHIGGEIEPAVRRVKAASVNSLRAS
jgi:fatty acid desaturase